MKDATIDQSRYYTTGTGQELIVHDESDCKGLYPWDTTYNCPIHNPSDHTMRAFPTHWRGDRGIMERICPHGVGHPDPDDVNVRNGDGVHGCDGCCRGAYRA